MEPVMQWWRRLGLIRIERQGLIPVERAHRDPKRMKPGAGEMSDGEPPKKPGKGGAGDPPPPDEFEE